MSKNQDRFSPNCVDEKNRHFLYPPKVYCTNRLVCGKYHNKTCITRKDDGFYLEACHVSLSPQQVCVQPVRRSLGPPLPGKRK